MGLRASGKRWNAYTNFTCARRNTILRKRVDNLHYIATGSRLSIVVVWFSPLVILAPSSMSFTPSKLAVATLARWARSYPPVWTLAVPTHSLADGKLFSNALDGGGSG